MLRSVYALAIGLFLLLTACTPGKQLTSINESAEAAYQAGNYAAALQSWESIIANYESNNTPKECPVYTKAGKAAMALGQLEKAIGYFEKDQYGVAVSAETFKQLALAYKKVDNLSEEMDALETYVKRYPNGADFRSMQKRLFETYVESGNWDLAIESWPTLDGETKTDLIIMEGYFTANKALKMDASCDTLAVQLQARDAKNIMALTWMAKKYYYKAENLYREEMEAYEKKRTNKQYKQLLKALDVVTADFKKSLGYFKTLYKLDPSPKNAQFLGHIYGRLDDKKKEAYYKSISGI